MDISEIIARHEALHEASDRLFNLHKNAEPSIELYHREAENLTFVKELYWTLIWQDYEG